MVSRHEPPKTTTAEAVQRHDAISKQKRPDRTQTEMTTSERYNPGADRAVLLLQRAQELLLECRAVAQQLEAPPAQPEPSAERAERIAYGVLVAALENGLVKTLQDAVEVLRKFSAPAGVLGEKWLNEQERRLGRKEPSERPDGPTPDR